MVGRRRGEGGQGEKEEGGKNSGRERERETSNNYFLS